MPETGQPPPLSDLDEDAALRTILEGTAAETGRDFFRALVENLARALGTHGAWVTEYLPETRRLRALAFIMGGQWVEDYEVDISGTPCERVIDSAALVHFPDRLLELYPHDPDVTNSGAVSYLGLPLTDVDGAILGHLAVVDRRPMPEQPRSLTIFRIFAARAAAELRRLRAERQLREREEKLGRLLDSAMDAVVELDDELRVTVANEAAGRVFGCSAGDLVGTDFAQRLTDGSREKLLRLRDELADRAAGRRSLWIPGGLEARRAGGEPFPAEATLTRYPTQGRSFSTLILRDVDERLEAERRIRTLTEQADYLRQEVDALHDFGGIIGRSEPLLAVLRDVAQVADTDAGVLILGETGTGKELIARAIHGASRRHDRPLISVNCAAIPDTLIESELFGHEKGAFTGATQRREGRFALADGGTIFLDEVGELPLRLQAKLLRVLQDGTFEPVGSAQGRTVDVRVLAATNRDLQQAIRDGEFREDLYYRLNVFPIHVPPLRQRRDDVPLLAETFARRYAERIGRTIEPITEDGLRRLRAYDWPGNVRELQNVIERAVIVSRTGRLDLDRALPAPAGGAAAGAPGDGRASDATIRTADEIEQLERDNLVRALEACGWKIAGDGGAAQRLGLKPSTLSSRMKALGVSRPAG